MTYQITDGNGNWIGRRLYTEAKFAVAVAKRAAKARVKNAKSISDGILYVTGNDGSVYGCRIATVTRSEVYYA